VRIGGAEYYQTFRVTSEGGLRRISNREQIWRWNGGGQYGEGFYLFCALEDAKRFRECEAQMFAKGQRQNSREVIVEVLLPKADFDKLPKAEVSPKHDWGMETARSSERYSGMRALRQDNHLVYGRWAPCPGYGEPLYDPMNAACQLAVVQIGMPSILNRALLRTNTTIRTAPLPGANAAPLPGANAAPPPAANAAPPPAANAAPPPAARPKRPDAHQPLAGLPAF
jgi:hypothetical protein